jgi:hypothetical protein
LKHNNCLLKPRLLIRFVSTCLRQACLPGFVWQTKY